MRTVKPEVAELMVAESIGDGGGISILDVLNWVFGKKRTLNALRNPKRDPEFIEFAQLIDAQVNKAWQERGINRRQGPYVNPNQ